MTGVARGKPLRRRKFCTSALTRFHERMKPGCPDSFQGCCSSLRSKWVGLSQRFVARILSIDVSATKAPWQELPSNLVNYVVSAWPSGRLCNEEVGVLLQQGEKTVFRDLLLSHAEEVPFARRLPMSPDCGYGPQSGSGNVGSFR